MLFGAPIDPHLSNLTLQVQNIFNRIHIYIYIYINEMLLEAPIGPHLSNLTLQAGGGLDGMKWLLSDLEDLHLTENTTDPVEALLRDPNKPASNRKLPITGSSKEGHRAVPLSGGRPSLNINGSERNMISARNPSARDRSPSFIQQQHESSRNLSGGSHLYTPQIANSGAILARNNSVAHMLGIRGLEENRVAHVNPSKVYH
jgi:hypothetical protein